MADIMSEEEQVEPGEWEKLMAELKKLRAEVAELQERVAELEEWQGDAHDHIYRKTRDR